MKFSYALVAAAALTQSSAFAQKPPQAPSSLEFRAALARLDRIEERLDALEKQKGVNAVADALSDCGCGSGKRCTCGVNCPCPPVKAAAATPAGMVVTGYSCSNGGCTPTYGYPGTSYTQPATYSYPASAYQYGGGSSSYGGYSGGGSCVGGSCGGSSSYGGGFGLFRRR